MNGTPMISSKILNGATYYLGSDKDGKYFLPADYINSIPPFLFGQRTEDATKEFFEEQVYGCNIFHAGAYIGDFFPILSVIAGNASRVLTFEPVPKSYTAAKICVTENGLKNVDMEQAGLGEKRGSMTIYQRDEDGYWLAQTARAKGKGLCEPVEVEVTTIDDAVGSERLGVLQLDLEGGEEAALSGASSTLKNDQMLVAVENRQPRLEQRFLSDWECIGCADNNFFYSKLERKGPMAALLRANLAILSQDWAAAEDHLSEADTVSGQPLVAEARARMLRASGHTLEAAEAGLELLDRHPNRFNAFEVLTPCLNLPEFKSIGSVLDNAFKTSRHPNAVYALLKHAAYHGGDIETGRDLAASYSTQFRRHPELALVWSQLAEQLQEFDEAVDAMERAAALRPTLAAFQTRLEMLKKKATENKAQSR